MKIQKYFSLQECTKIIATEVINFKIKNAQELLTFTENLYKKKKRI